MSVKINPIQNNTTKPLNKNQRGDKVNSIIKGVINENPDREIDYVRALVKEQLVANRKELKLSDKKINRIIAETSINNVKNEVKSQTPKADVKPQQKPTGENFRANFVVQQVEISLDPDKKPSKSEDTVKNTTRKQQKTIKKLKKQNIDINDVMATNVTIARENKNQKRITHNIKTGKIEGISLNQPVDTTPHISSKSKKNEKKINEFWSQVEHRLNRPVKDKSLKNAKTIPFYYEEITIFWSDLSDNIKNVTQQKNKQKLKKRNKHYNNYRNYDYTFNFRSTNKNEKTSAVKNITETAKKDVENKAAETVKQTEKAAEKVIKKSNNKWLVALGCLGGFVLGYFVGFKKGKNSCNEENTKTQENIVSEDITQENTVK